MNRSDFPHLQTRRDFFRQAACAAVGTLSIATTIRDLRFINTAAAQGTLSDYKALVCIFLGGGNDSNNLIIPVGPEYANYAAVRQDLALPAGAVLPISPLNPDGHSYALHPALPEMQTLFNEGKAALLFNVGPLVYPMTRAQYNTVPKPPQLFSHSDQVTHWQTSLPDQLPKTGWGGRIADLMHPQQWQLVGGVPTANSAKIALCTSLSGANIFEVGNNFAQYHVSTGGAVTVSGVNSTQIQRMKDILALPDVNLQLNALAGVTKNAINTGALLNTSIDNTVEPGSTRTTGQPGTWVWNTAFPNSSLGRQLKMVARLIEARIALNMKRQIFFTEVGGYDTHAGQVGDAVAPADTTVGTHANLLNELSEAVFAFQRAMEQINTATTVTAFTMSDFGRTLKTNGQGSDHAWGGHHFIIGGAVVGQRTYGTFPVLQVNGPDAVPLSNEGRWIPKVSVDEYSATLAKWFGVSAGDMSAVFPNIGRFATPDLGFMG